MEDAWGDVISARRPLVDTALLGIPLQCNQFSKLSSLVHSRYKVIGERELEFHLNFTFANVCLQLLLAPIIAHPRRQLDIRCNIPAIHGKIVLWSGARRSGVLCHALLMRRNPVAHAPKTVVGPCNATHSQSSKLSALVHSRYRVTVIILVGEN